MKHLETVDPSEPLNEQLPTPKDLRAFPAHGPRSWWPYPLCSMASQPEPAATRHLPRATPHESVVISRKQQMHRHVYTGTNLHTYLDSSGVPHLYVVYPMISAARLSNEPETFISLTT